MFIPTGQRFRIMSCLAVVGLLGAASWLWAHAGHAPLPSRGAAVDLEHGRLVLSAASRSALDVQTAEVATRPVEESVPARATLIAPWRQHAFATSRLSGRIIRLLARPGDTVAIGQPLAEIQSAELEDMQLEVRNAETDLRLADDILAALEESRKKGAVSEQKLDEVRSRRQEAAGTLDIARRKWQSLGQGGETSDSFARTLMVRSPIDGVVIHSDLITGKVIEPNEHLFEVVDLSTVWVKLDVLEADLGRLGEGQRVDLRLAAYPGQALTCRVDRLDAGLDPITHQGAAWAQLDNPKGIPARFLPGMVGEARLVLPSARPSTVVPANAVLRDGAERYVLVEESATTAVSEYQKRNVVVGRTTNGFVAVEGGLYAGDRVVTRGGHELATFFFQGTLKPGPEATRNIGLKVATVEQRTIEDTVDVDGAIELPPERRVVVSVPLTGTIRRILVAPGQAVHVGDVLAEVDSLEFQTAQLDLVRAHLQTTLLEEAARRLRQIQGGIPLRQVLEAENAFQTARNRRDALRHKLENLGVSSAEIDQLINAHRWLDALPVRAAIDGQVVRFDRALGQAFKAEEPLFEVHDLSRPWVQAFISEAELGRLRLDPQHLPTARVRLTAEPSFVGPARVVRSGQVLTSGRSLSVWAELDGPVPKVVRDGMLARVTLTLGKGTPMLAVPLSAVVREGGRASVFVRQADGSFVPHGVKTGRTDDRFIAIADGLNAGDVVATEGVAGLQTAYAALK
jgi:RND family efflux transporter MFP subunit